MTITETCTYVDIESTLIDTFISDQTNRTLTLSVNNYTTTTTLELELADLTAGSPNYYRLTLADLSQTDEFTNGVYKLTVTLEETGEDDLTDTGCWFSKCGLNCEIIEHYASNGKSMAHVYYSILSDNLNQCSECDCDDAYLVYKELRYILDGIKTKECAGC